MGFFTKLTGMAAVEVAANQQPAKFTTKTYLRIKIISLALEAQAIRREERRWIVNGRRDHPIRMGLMEHRKRDVRQEARAAQLAYGFLRGRPYASLEAPSSRPADWGRVVALVAKYGGYDQSSRNLHDQVLKDVVVWRMAACR